MNHEHIEQVAAVFDATPRLTEIEVRSAGVALRLRRAAPGTFSAKNGPRPSASSVPALASAANITGGSPLPSLSAASATAGAKTMETPADAGNTLVTAHMVGIFRATARSGRANGAEAAGVGEVVVEGQSLGSVETMRILNDCAAPVSGVLHAVYVSEGQPVEYGQALFEIVPSPDAPASTES